MKEPMMIVVRKQRVNLYVDHSTQHWVVLDPDGNFWDLPSVENAWSQRQPFQPTDESELELVPGHYKYMLDLPFN
jgi:hypothetical protein